jgi:hypothetical protein
MPKGCACSTLCQGIAHDDFAASYNVLVGGASHQRADLAQGSDGEAVGLLLHLELLQGDTALAFSDFARELRTNISPVSLSRALDTTPYEPSSMWFKRS